MRKDIYTIICFVAVTLFTASCTIDEPKRAYLTHNEQIREIVGKGKLLQLNDLKKAPYMSETGNYCDPALYRLRASGKGHLLDSYLDTIWLFSIDTIPTTRPLYIRGRITTDDLSGNFYKSFCIQQFVDGKQQALRISVDASSISGMYPIGQEILIRVDGLCIGRYANQPQLCVPSYNNNTNANKYSEKTGWAPGRIPFAEFKKRTTLIGRPRSPRCDTITIAEFVNNLNQVENRLDDGRLVCIKDVHYTGQYSDMGELQDCVVGNPDDFDNGSNVNVFAPTTGNMGYPQSRAIADEAGNVTLVSVSEYAKFSHFYLPGADKSGISHCSDYKGYITGILGYYRDNNNTRISGNTDSNAPAWDDWSVTIRSLDDLELYLDGDSSNGLWPRSEYSK